VSVARYLAPMDWDHLPQVKAIEARAYAFPWAESSFDDCLRVGYCAWILLDDDGAVLAYAIASLAVGEAQILNICVDPAHRRQGLARQLLDHLIVIARGAGCEIMLLEVRESNTAAIALYESYGFARIGLRKHYYRAADGRGEHALVLSLDLGEVAS
jgi:ribosomal-protein-alanine N-acetyltransferase